MTATELRAALKKLGISQLEAARRLRITGRTMQRYVASDTHIPGPVEILVEQWLTASPPSARKRKVAR
jgi:hypothetical protein